MELRCELREKDMEINIYKNSFVFRALSNSKLKVNLENYIEGPNAFDFQTMKLFALKFYLILVKKMKNLL